MAVFPVGIFFQSVTEGIISEQAQYPAVGGEDQKIENEQDNLGLYSGETEGEFFPAVPEFP